MGDETFTAFAHLCMHRVRLSRVPFRSIVCITKRDRITNEIEMFVLFRELERFAVTVKRAAAAKVVVGSANNVMQRKIEQCNKQSSNHYKKERQVRININIQTTMVSR